MRKDESAYRRICKEKRTRLIKEDNWRCFFSDEELPIEGSVSFHHLGGRQGAAPDGTDLYLYEPWIVPVIDKYHRKYHDMTVEKLLFEWWYPGFMERLFVLSPHLYTKETFKQDTQ